MPDWLMIQLVLAVLLVTSFTCVGLLALWAATSPRHWFVRAAAVVAALLPLLLVPAYEPLVVFALQSVIVAAGVSVYRWRQRRRARHTQQPTAADQVAPTVFRFSLSSLLLAMVLLAFTSLVMARLPMLNYFAWSSALIVGAACGLVTLIAAWMFVSRRKWLAWPIGLLLCIGMGAILWGIDWFAYSIVQQLDWPPRPASIPMQMVGTNQPPVLVWLYTLPIIAVVQCMLVMWWSAAFGPSVDRQPTGRRRRRGRLMAARALWATAILLLGAFPLFLLVQMMQSLPVPRPRLPSPNGYDDLVAAGQAILSGSPMLNTAIDPATTEELAAEVRKFAHTFERIRLGLSRPIEVPVWPIEENGTILNMNFAQIQPLRAAGRALNSEAALAQQQLRFADAARISVDSIHLGKATAQGGLIIHHLVGVAIEGLGQSSLYPSIAHLEADACGEMLAALDEVDQSREPLENVFHRERIYAENAWGWFGHLLVLLHDMSNTYREAHWATTQATNRITAVRHLLKAEIALRKYRLETGRLPSQLNDLVPDYMSTLPTDPYDPNGGALRYAPTADGYVLYSVGYDRDDDGGRPTPRESGLLDDGDIRLDSWFAPEEEEPIPPDDELSDEEVDESDVDAMDRTDEQ
ncbi:MAG TPA: hypothetical protein VHK01_14155 [Lacipirellulaceae bacterium]|nr:hypothetical protein [Lacipirellulaceae bacterium]